MPDGSPDKDVRVFVGRADGNKRTFKYAGKPVPLPPGKYTVDGWKHRGKTYASVTFTISVREKKKVVLRAN